MTDTQTANFMEETATADRLKEAAEIARDGAEELLLTFKLTLKTHDTSHQLALLKHAAWLADAMSKGLTVQVKQAEKSLVATRSTPSNAARPTRWAWILGDTSSTCTTTHGHPTCRQFPCRTTAEPPCSGSAPSWPRQRR